MKNIIQLLIFINPFYTAPIPIEVEEPAVEYEEYHNPYLGINQE